mgnify:CR=1 FL=1
MIHVTSRCFYCMRKNASTSAAIRVARSSFSDRYNTGCSLEVKSFSCTDPSLSSGWDVEFSFSNKGWWSIWSMNFERFIARFFLAAITPGIPLSLPQIPGHSARKTGMKVLAIHVWEHYTPLVILNSSPINLAWPKLFSQKIRSFPYNDSKNLPCDLMI